MSTTTEQLLVITLHQIVDAAIDLWSDEESAEKQAALYRATDIALAVLDQMALFRQEGVRDV